MSADAIGLGRQLAVSLPATLDETGPSVPTTLPGTGPGERRASTVTERPYERFQMLTDAPHHRPTVVAAAKASRQRPESPYGPHGRMMVVAADHAARGALSAGKNPMAMADRREVLDRLCHALTRPEVNGVLGSPDVLEELLLLGALENKTVFGSMNRGGLAGSSFEMDDRFTSYTPRALAASRFEGGKMLLRIDSQDPMTVRTLEACGQTVDGLADHRLLAMVEPFISHRRDGKVVNDLRTEAVTRAVGIAAALGSTAAFTWLKVPVVPDMERVLAASTLPALILGGDVVADQDRAYVAWAEALRQPTAQGFVLGRSLLFPTDDDVDAALDAVIGLL